EGSEPEHGFIVEGGSGSGPDRTYDASLEEIDVLVGDASSSPREYAVDPRDQAVEESMGGPPTERPASGNSIPAGALEAELAEADFYVGRGMIAEARRILGELTRRYPGHPLVAAKMKDVESAPRVPVPSGEGPRRVIAKPLGGPDADTHYDL